MATVTGKILLPSGSAFVGEIKFCPMSTPLVATPSLITTATITVTTDSNGDFTQDFEAGVYRVYVGASKPVYIQVPDGATSHAFLDLIISTLPSASAYTWTPGGSIPIATTTVAGAVKISSAEADPIVLLLSDGVERAPANGSFRVKDGKYLQIYNSTTTNWHTIWVVGAAGSEQLAIGEGEA